MRRHKSWLKWSLGIVVAAFILLYIPSFLAPTPVGAGVAATDVIATVDGRPITAALFQRAYSQQLTQLQSAYGALDASMIEQLQLAPGVLQQLITQEAMVAEAVRRGLTVTDGELREHIVRIPGFQENGQFIGWTRYRQMLQGARPPLSPAEFETEVRNSVLSQKLQAAVTGWLHVSEADVETEYRQRHEQVQLDLAVFNAVDFEDQVEVSDEDLRAEYDANPDAYRVPEQRRVRYASIDAIAMRDTIGVTTQEVQARYNENIGTYSQPEQVRASHILFQTDGENDDAVREAAEAVLVRARAGEDFAELAREFSDDTSAESGGDLGYFGRGAMVPEFELSAWALEPGEISDLVETPYGFHIIQLVDKQAATTRTIDEVRPQIEDQIKAEEAQTEATRIAEEIAAAVDTPADLEREAEERGLTLGDSGLFTSDEPLGGLGYAPNVAAEAFAMEVDEVSDQIVTSQGYAIIALDEVVPAATPPFDDVVDQVRQSIVSTRALDIAREQAGALSEDPGTDFAAAVEREGATLRSTELITRGSTLPEIGINPRIDRVAFDMEVGATSQPIETDAAVVVVHVQDRENIDPDALEAERETLRAELTQARRERFFQAYLSDAMDRMTIAYNDETVDRLLASY